MREREKLYYGNLREAFSLVRGPNCNGGSTS